MSAASVVAYAKAPVKEQFTVGPWTCTAVKSHILSSEGNERTQ